VRLRVARDFFIRALFPLTAFISALLLFQVEFILGKLILPWFGGSPAAWTTSLVAFQILLLGGYAYAHGLARALPKTQRYLHSALLAGSLLLLIVQAAKWPSPITPGAGWKPQDLSLPELRALAILAAAIGLPFFVLAASVPLLAHWLVRVNSNRSYKLYAVSNTGALLGLFSYPILVEPHLALRSQGWVWSLGYVLFAISMGACAAIADTTGELPGTSSGPRASPPAPPSRARVGAYWLWLALAGCGSASLVAVTHVVCQDIAPTALLWSIPLSLYLLSFVITFGSSRWYGRGVGLPLLAGAIMIAFVARCTHSVVFQLPAYLAALFAICMACHGELARCKPSATRTTSFYLAIAAGGALGSILAGVLAPQIFPDFWEFEIVLWAPAALMIITAVRDQDSWWYSGQAWWGATLVGAGLLIPSLAGSVNSLVGATLNELHFYQALVFIPAAVVASIAVHRVIAGKPTAQRVLQICVLALLMLYGYLFIGYSRWRSADLVARTRNFFGVIMVQRDRIMTYLIHGATFQGAQYRAISRVRLPTLYYGYDSGIGVLLENLAKRRLNNPMRLGVVGLGAGTLAAYGRPGDYIRFYEINPAIARLSQGAHPVFTYLSDCPSGVDVILGDARVSLEAEAARGDRQNFDVLVLDAFNGDETPTHLLTREAVDVYLVHLAPDGVLAFHTTQASLDLKPVIQSLGAHFSLATLALTGRDQETDGTNEWVLLSRNRVPLDAAELSRLQAIPNAGELMPVWTDDYSSVWPLITKALNER
jgi:hypothetical protein